MSGCECKSGFFSLRDCDGAPAGACSECGRAACTRPLSPASGFTQCLDCHARAAQQPQEEEGAAAKGAPADPALDDEWTYGARHRFYTSGYSPVYAGSHRSHYSDSYDTRSFDETDAAEADVDAGGAGFGDS